jgi:hypothetical protein
VHGKRIVVEGAKAMTTHTAPTLAEQVKSLNLPPMTQDELAVYCGLTPLQWSNLKVPIDADTVAFCHEARALEILLPRWQAGIDPYPSDVNVNKARPKRRAGEQT